MRKKNPPKTPQNTQKGNQMESKKGNLKVRNEEKKG